MIVSFALPHTHAFRRALVRRFYIQCDHLYFYFCTLTLCIWERVSRSDTTTNADADALFSPVDPRMKLTDDIASKILFHINLTTTGYGYLRII